MYRGQKGLEPHLDVACPTPWKLDYVCRKAARARLRRNPERYGGEPQFGVPVRRPRAYLCVCGCWHLGHLGSTVVAGRSSRAERFAG